MAKADNLEINVSAWISALELKNHNFLTLVEPKKKKKKRKKLGVDGELLIKKPKGRPKVKQDGNSLILSNIQKIMVVEFHEFQSFPFLLVNENWLIES